MADKEAKTATTTSRVVMQSVTVVRDGKRVTPEIGKPFPFTNAEITYLDKNAKGALRKAVNEDADMETPGEEPEGGDTGDDATAPDQKAKATATRTPRRGANAAEKKAAAKDAEDAEDAEEGDEGEDDDI